MDIVTFIVAVAEFVTWNYFERNTQTIHALWGNKTSENPQDNRDDRNNSNEIEMIGIIAMKFGQLNKSLSQ